MTIHAMFAKGFPYSLFVCVFFNIPTRFCVRGMCLRTLACTAAAATTVSIHTLTHHKRLAGWLTDWMVVCIRFRCDANGNRALHSYMHTYTPGISYCSLKFAYVWRSQRQKINFAEYEPTSRNWNRVRLKRWLSLHMESRRHIEQKANFNSLTLVLGIRKNHKHHAIGIDWHTHVTHKSRICRSTLYSWLRLHKQPNNPSKRFWFEYECIHIFDRLVACMRLQADYNRPTRWFTHTHTQRAIEIAENDRVWVNEWVSVDSGIHSLQWYTCDVCATRCHAVLETEMCASEYSRVSSSMWSLLKERSDGSE